MISDVTVADPRVLELLGRCPDGWLVTEQRADGNRYAKRPLGLLHVIESFAVETDGRWWQHVSCSRLERLPSWGDLRAVKHAFVGDDREAYLVFPTADRYVNLNGHVLHLWSCLDGPALPAFDRGMGTI